MQISHENALTKIALVEMTVNALQETVSVVLHLLLENAQTKIVHVEIIANAQKDNADVVGINKNKIIFVLKNVGRFIYHVLHHAL